ncbi:MAG: transketolase [Anaerolineae bacterium]|nr:transketolase [Anaerolineae bacterium]
MDAVQQANSGHPGLPMGAAPMAYVLWTRHLRHHPASPGWFNRDRFILSAGHGSMLLYALLHLTGYDLPLVELQNFRQWGSKTPGHPEYRHTPGVETTTGPLGQGGATAVGMALAEAYLAQLFNRPGHTVVDHYTYALVSDGDLMEGVFMEACALAGHWGLGKLIFLYDDNQITLDGAASMTLSEDIAARFRAQGWHTLSVADGNDLEAIDQALHAARAVTNQPSLIAVRTVIGYGSPNKAGTSKAHGSPLGADEIRLTKQAYGWDPDAKFAIPADALAHLREALSRGQAQEADWNARVAAWKTAHPELAATWDAALSGTLPAGWDADLRALTWDKPTATRVAGGDALNAIAGHLPTMIGGDADLAGSTRTLIKGAGNTGQGQPAARNLRFGVREHGMGAIVNGLTLHGGLVKPYSATFLQFADYMRPAIRLGALMDIPALYIFTHDSIGLGEDGPTHQPVEQLTALRAIPNLYVFRPADATETAACWHTIMTLPHPAVLALSRQDLPVLGGDNPEGIYEGVARGGYILAESKKIKKGRPDLILIATGSEVSLALAAFDALDEEGVKVRLVSMPCQELFDAQPEGYQEAVLPPEVYKRISIEAGATLGWYKYVGGMGIAIGVDTFGASAPYERLYQEYGLTAAAIVEAAGELLDDE